MYRNVFYSILVSMTVFLCVAALSAQRVGISHDPDENRILSLINNERSKTGLGQLSWDDRLADLARQYSEKMAREHFFEHIDSDGNDVVARARQNRIRGWSKIGENLFTCDPTDEVAKLSVYGWMHSPSHKENILDPEWRETGIGIAYARNGEIYITEVFANG
jgi:uncharacterized protein YkwD